MNEVYVLISGAYSDWNIEGFVESEEEAIKTCIAFNEGEKERLGDNYSDWNDIYYMKANKFNKVNSEELKQIHPIYEYRVMAWKRDGSWKFDDEDSIEIDAVKESHPNIQFYKGGFLNDTESANIHLTLKTLDRKKALKVAQDMLYQKLAERERL